VPRSSFSRPRRCDGTSQSESPFFVVKTLVPGHLRNTSVGEWPPTEQQHYRRLNGRGSEGTTVMRLCTRTATSPGIRKLRYILRPLVWILKISVPGSFSKRRRIDSGDMFQRNASSFTL